MMNSKRMFIKLGFLSLFLVTISSCSNEPNFPKELNISTENISNDIFIARPRSLSLVNDWLIWRDQQGGYFYGGLNLKKNEYHRLARMGKSGKEFESWPTVSTFGNEIALFSHSQKYYQPWQVDSIPSENYFPPRIEFQDSLGLTLKVFRRPDSSFISTGYNTLGLFSLFNKDGSFNKVAAEYPFMKRGTDMNVHALASMNSDIIYHPEKDKILFGYLFAAQFVVYDLSNDQVIQDWAVDRWPFEYRTAEGSVRLTNDTKYGFVDFTCNDNYIYALYANAPAGSDAATYATTIEVYDWEGNPVSKLNLDRAVCQIAINEDGNELYGIGVDQENISILKARIPVL